MNLPDPVTLRSRIKLRQLLLLEALEGERSLHKAARRIAMTQPNATRLLNELEDLLGAALFERSASGMVTTPYGEAMTHHAKALLADLDRTAQDIPLKSRGNSGHVRAGTMPSTRLARTGGADPAEQRGPRGPGGATANPGAGLMLQPGTFYINRPSPRCV